MENGDAKTALGPTWHRHTLIFIVQGIGHFWQHPNGETKYMRIADVFVFDNSVEQCIEQADLTSMLGTYATYDSTRGQCEKLRPG